MLDGQRGVRVDRVVVGRVELDHPIVTGRDLLGRLDDRFGDHDATDLARARVHERAAVVEDVPAVRI